jgi:hypothetical protein
MRRGNLARADERADSIEPRLSFSPARTRPLVVETVKRRATKPKPVPRWRISLLKGTLAKFLGYIDAPDEKAAIEAAAKSTRSSMRCAIGSSRGATHDPRPSPHRVPRRRAPAE